MFEKKRAILLGGGIGSRLFPLTKVTSKQLLGLYDKPVVAYPLQTLKDLGYVDILIIAGNKIQRDAYKSLLGDGSRFDLRLSYTIQDAPRGLADAFIVGEDFIKDADEIALILGDNVIISEQRPDFDPKPNTIFTFKVKDPSAYGVAKLNEWGELDDIVEKPEEFIGEDAVIGLYIFSNDVIELAKSLKPSIRGELEIVDLIKLLHKKNGVYVQPLNGFWFDVGDHDSLLDCANLIKTITKRTTRELGLKNL